MATKKTIATTMAPPTITPDSRKDNIFCEDNNSRKLDCEDDTRNGDGEDDRNYDVTPRLALSCDVRSSLSSS